MLISKFFQQSLTFLKVNLFVLNLNYANFFEKIPAKSALLNKMVLGWFFEGDKAA
jgi:hypothetical protein